MKIVVLDGYAANPGDLSWKELEALGELTVYDRTRPGELIGRASEADVLLTNKVLVGEREMEQLPRLKYIGVLATGYNVVDTVAARKRGIIVTNVPAYSTESVAQAVFAHLLTVTNRTEHYAVQNRAGRWSACTDFCYWDTELTELSGKTFGIVGLGNIGMRVAAIAHAFGMQVIAFTSKSAEQLPPYIVKATMDELLSRSDIISLHCPLTPETHHLVNRQTLQKMKSTAILINTGRGQLVDDQELAAALAKGRLTAYCTDVLTEEPPRAFRPGVPTEEPPRSSQQSQNPLLQCSNAFITPHIAWATREARARLIAVSTGNVRAFAEGKPRNVVNQ